MNTTDLRKRVARSRLAPVAALPLRARTVARHDGRVIADSIRWLVGSRERHNYTYDLTPLNQEHLAWFIAGIADADVSEVRSYLDEVEQDQHLVEHVVTATAASPWRGMADKQMRLGRRAGWYALVRILRPDHVVETGTDKGLGSCTLAAALRRNGSGRLTTMDVNPDSGYLITGRYAEVTDRVVCDSLKALGELERPVDVFLHDSLHTFEHETAEFEAVEPRLSDCAVVLTDNGELSDALPRWAETTGRRFAFFSEAPDGHWHPGSGIGAAWRR